VPTYSYACTECDHRFDAVQAFSDDALTECPECTGRLRKLFNSVGVVFKGSGFYRTDSREAAKSGSAAGSSGKSAESSGSSESGGSKDSSSSGTSSDSGSSSASPAASSSGGASTPAPATS